MGVCLTDQDLGAYVGGSAAPEQMSAWNEHLDDCDSCAARLARKASGRTVSAASADDNENPGPAAETVTLKPPADAALDAGAALPEDAIPGYRILKELHRGGQGVVYQAVQEAAKRKVALKVMLEGPFASKDSKRRFEREIALVGSLRHPGIVPIFDSGVAQGRFFYAMEYIRGERLNEYVQSRKLSVDDTLRLLEKVCDAVDYAHQKGVIHRDLKPSNILVDDAGEPYVLDFGLAKVGGAEADETLVSVTGQVIGTPAYMSPEQARGRPDQVDMRSDVYALGVVLYEALTGQHPYEVVGELTDVLRNIKEEAPRRPSTIRRQINDEVETIVLKCLAKEKERRYYAAGPLGEDIQRFLSDEPIEAKRDSALYVIRKTLLRYKAPAAVAAGFTALLVASSILAWGLYAREQAARQHAVDAQQHAVDAQQRERERAEELEYTTYLQRIALARTALDRHNLREFGNLLDGCKEELQGWEWRHLDFARTSATTRSRVLSSGHQRIKSVAISPNGERIAVASSLGVSLFDGDDSSQRPTELTPSTAYAVRFASGGQRLIAGCTDNFIRVWDVDRNVVTDRWGHGAAVLDVAIGDDEKDEFVVSVGQDGSVKRWHFGVEVPVWEVQLPDTPLGWSAACSHDGKRVFVGAERGLFSLETEDGAIEWAQRDIRGVVLRVAVAPNDAWIAWSSLDGTIHLSDAQDGHELETLTGHSGWVLSLVITSDGRRLVSAGFDSVIRVWDLSSLRLAQTLPGHEGSVASLALSPDAAEVVSGGEDGEVRRTRLDRFGDPLSQPTRDSGDAIAASQDGKWLAIGEFYRGIRIFDQDTGLLRKILPEANVKILAFSPDSTMLAAGTELFRSLREPGRLVVWETRSWTKLTEIEHPTAVRSLAFTSNNERIATACDDGTINIRNTRNFNVADAKLERQDGASAVAFSPSGNVLAISSRARGVCLWDRETGRLIAEDPDHQARPHSLAYSPDGTLLASAGSDRKLRIWQVHADSLEIEAEITVTAEPVAFTPDGSRLAAGCGDGTIRLWDTTTWKETLKVARLDAPTHAIAFSPGGDRLFARGRSVAFDAKVWHTEIAQTEYAPSVLQQRLERIPPHDRDYAFRLRLAGRLADRRRLDPADTPDRIALWLAESAPAEPRRPEDNAFFDTLDWLVRTPQQWLVVGPFTNGPDPDTFNELQGPEAAGVIAADATYDGVSRQVKWQPHTVHAWESATIGQAARGIRQAIDFLDFYPGFPGPEEVSAYAVTYLQAVQAGGVTLRLHCDDRSRARVWLDDKLIINLADARPVNDLYHDHEITLSAEYAHKLVVKTEQVQGGWGFAVELLGLTNGWPARVACTADPDRPRREATE